jgi:hypothetical protein
MNFRITRSGVTDPAKANKTPYGFVHVTDFMDVWPHYGQAFGIDHLFLSNGEVKLRVMGKKLHELP